MTSKLIAKRECEAASSQGAVTPEAVREAAANSPVSDEVLAERALAAIGKAIKTDASDVRTTLRHGWLTSEGGVETFQRKEAVEEAVRHLGQMRDVSNNLALENDVLARRVNQSIDETFAAQAHLRALRIVVTACDQKIILSGTAASVLERDEAEAAAWSVPGVAHVVNRIRALA